MIGIYSTTGTKTLASVGAGPKYSSHRRSAGSLRVELSSLSQLSTLVCQSLSNSCTRPGSVAVSRIEVAVIEPQTSTAA